MSLPYRFLRRILVLVVAALSGASAQGASPTIHFKPADHALGDVHPYFEKGNCFLFYLKPGRYEAALARSVDGLDWKETPLTHGAVRPDDWYSAYFVLGVFRDQAAGLYRSFYGHRGGRVASSVSRDLLHWDCAPQEYHIPPADYYERRRDPFVFWIPETGKYGCVMTTWVKGQPKETGGAVSLATSPDLRKWTDHGLILDPGDIGEPECPQMFHLGGRWYLLASIYGRAVGRPVYWTSAAPTGPWPRTPAGALDGKDLCAAQLAFDAGRPILFGWIPLHPARPGSQHWGGHLALPREVHALPDGTLATRLSDKLRQRFASLPWQDLPDLESQDELRLPTRDWTKLALEFQLQMPSGAAPLRLRCDPLGEVVLRREQLEIRDARGESWSTLAVRLPEDVAFPVRLFVEQDMVELFVDDRHSLVARLPATAVPLCISARAPASSPRLRLTKVRAAEWRFPP